GHSVLATRETLRIRFEPQPGDAEVAEFTLAQAEVEKDVTVARRMRVDFRKQLDRPRVGAHQRMHHSTKPLGSDVAGLSLAQGFAFRDRLGMTTVPEFGLHCADALNCVHS